MFGKVEDGKLVLAPREFLEGGKKIVGFTDSFLKDRGYKKIEFSQPPDDENEYNLEYKDTGDVIVQVWSGTQ